MSERIIVTTGDLRNQAKSISDVAMLVSEISGKNNNAINKMTNACSFMRVGSISFSAKHIIQSFTTLMDTLNRGASRALECAYAYEEASDDLKSKFNEWFDNVEIGNATQGIMKITTGNEPIPMSGYLSTVTDAEYAKLNQIWTDVCDEEDPLSAFLKRLSELPENDPLRNLTADQISITKSISGLAAISIKGSDGNALVIFAGTKDFADILNDIMIVEGAAPPQEIEALAIIAELSQTHPNITVSGYSLGGYLATAAALKCPSVMKCVTFDPPGRYDTFLQQYLNSDAWSKITTYEANGSVVSSVGLASGEWQVLSVTDNWAGPFPNHGIGEIYDALGGDSAINNSWAQGASDLYTGNNYA